MTALLSTTHDNPSARTFGAANPGISANPADKYAAFTLNELDALYEAFFLSAEAITGILCQPRCTSDNVQSFLSERSEEMERETTLIAEELRRRRPTEYYERKQRIHRLMIHEARCGCGPLELKALADEMAETAGH